MKLYNLTWADVEERAAQQALEISSTALFDNVCLYGVPRGGLLPVLLVQKHLQKHGIQGVLVEEPEQAAIFIDDIVDTGNTRLRYQRLYGDKPFHALVEVKPEPACWVVFPWERMSAEQGPEDNVRRVLEYIGEDPEREGLLETPARVVKSWSELFGGYRQNPSNVLKVFKDGACNEMVVLKDIEFFSTCEHHMLPFFGRAHIGYIPDGKVVGVSKLARILEIFARRLQIQERIGQQVTKAITELLQPKGCGCILSAQHFCMTSRGVEKQNSVMVTSSLQGAFYTPEVRGEFLRMCGL